LLLAALAVRLVYGLALVGPTTGADTPLFYSHALHLLAGQGYGQPDRPPGFPVILAATIRLFGGYPASIVVVQCALSAVVAPLLYLAGRNLFGEAAGVLAGVFSVFHFPLIDYARVVQSDVLFALTVAALAWVLSPGAGWRRAALGGGLLGLCALTRGTALAFFPFMALLGATRLGPRAAGRAGRAALVVGMACLTLAPWAYRNFRREGRFVPVSSEGGLNFFQGASVYYFLTGQTDIELARELTGWDSGDNDELIQPQFQAALMGYWWRQWAERPGQQIALRVISLLDFWSPVERVRDYALGPGNLYWAVTYGALLPFFALGAHLMWRRGVPGTYFLLAAIAGTTVLHMLTHAEQARYRGLSVESLIVLAAMYGVVEWWNYRRAGAAKTG